MPPNGRHVSQTMLTGDQIAAARRLAGFRTQADLAKAARLGRATIERAEAAKAELPTMNVAGMAAVVSALEAAGVQFYLTEGSSLVGGIGMRGRAR